MPVFSFELENRAKPGLLQGAEKTLGGQVFDSREGFFGFRRLRSRRQHKDEFRAFSRFAFNPDLSTMHFHELLADRKAQSCPFEFFRGRAARLLIGMKDRGLILGGDAGP